MIPNKPVTAYLGNLTPLRGIAALLVVFYHVDLTLVNGNLLLKYPQSHLVEKLYLMVDFFFVLSGFIMMHVYGKWFLEKVRGASFKQFTIARFARVYPIHFVTLIYLVVVFNIFLSAGGKPGPFEMASNTWPAVFSNLFLVQSLNLHHWFSWNNAAWSISTEWWMYMLFPFLVRPFFRLRTTGRILVFLGCIGGYLLIMFYLQKFVKFPDEFKPFIPSDYKRAADLNVAYQFGFVRCLIGFVNGMLTYLLYKDGIGKKFFGRGIVLIGFSLASLLCFHFGLWDVIGVTFFPFIFLSAAYGSAKMDAFFGKKSMQRIGDWSFSIYMVHQPLIFTISYIYLYLNPPDAKAILAPPTQPVWLSWLTCIVFIAITLLVAALSYRFIEVPARKWINRKFVGGHYEPHVNPVVTT